jgi:hypothetical protein
MIREGALGMANMEEVYKSLVFKEISMTVSSVSSLIIDYCGFVS